MKGEFKFYEIRGGSLDDNCLKGAASVVGNLDRYDDVIFPGFYKKALKAFLADGFVAVGHNWRGLPVAMPIVAEERGNQLYTECEFHSTEEAQAARTVCKERLAAGLSVGLSVGFSPDYADTRGVVWFETGKKLLEYAEANGYDMSLFDTKAIKAHSRYCRGLIKCRELYEYSIVTVPANQDALATNAKSFNPGQITTERDFERFLRDAGVPKELATAVTLHGWKAATLRRDAEEAEQDNTGTEDEARKESALLVYRTLALRTASLLP